jgi:hypothetical protein
MPVAQKRWLLRSFEGLRETSQGSPVAMARGRHLFPFRTEQLSPSAPMVLGPQGPGRVGRRRFRDQRWAAPLGGPSCVCRTRSSRASRRRPAVAGRARRRASRRVGARVQSRDLRRHCIRPRSGDRPALVDAAVRPGARRLRLPRGGAAAGRRRSVDAAAGREHERRTPCAAGGGAGHSRDVDDQHGRFAAGLRVPPATAGDRRSPEVALGGPSGLCRAPTPSGTSPYGCVGRPRTLTPLEPALELDER